MGPVTNKIDKLIKNPEISDETKVLLENLKDDISSIEMLSINQAYDKGHFDSERGIRVGNYYQKKYPNYVFSTNKK